MGTATDATTKRDVGKETHRARVGRGDSLVATEDLDNETALRT